jgi:hypothetical protein
VSRPVSPPSQGLPGRIRFAAAVCLVLSGCTGLTAFKEVVDLGRLSEMKEERLSRLASVEERAIHELTLEATVSTLEGMREPRALILGALVVACALTFVSASRLLRPEGLPMESMRRLLGGAAIATAILRTMDGAQVTVVFQRIGQAMAGALGKTLTLPPELDAATLEGLKSALPSFMATAAMLWTAVMAGTFALLGQYFRSERVRQVIIAQDGPLEEE